MQDFRVMSWNVENLFQPGDVVSKFPRKVMEQSAYEAKLGYLTQVISEVAPEVIALQELGARRSRSRSRLETSTVRCKTLTPIPGYQVTPTAATYG